MKVSELYNLSLSRSALNDAAPTVLRREARTEEVRPVQRETPLNPQFTGPRSR